MLQCSQCDPMIFIYNDTAPTQIYTLSLHDALPICRPGRRVAESVGDGRQLSVLVGSAKAQMQAGDPKRSEEHTSELQSRRDLVCRLLLEKKRGSSRASGGSSTAHLNGCRC